MITQKISKVNLRARRITAVRKLLKSSKWSLAFIPEIEMRKIKWIIAVGCTISVSLAAHGQSNDNNTIASHSGGNGSSNSASYTKVIEDSAGFALNKDNSGETDAAGLRKDPENSLARDHIQPDGFLIVNFKLVRIKNGVVTVMDTDIRLKNGSIVLREGYVVRPNGFIILINQGEYLDMTGKILPINKSDVFID